MCTINSQYCFLFCRQCCATVGLALVGGCEAAPELLVVQRAAWVSTGWRNPRTPIDVTAVDRC
jgi:hypothetical protein